MQKGYFDPHPSLPLDLCAGGHLSIHVVETCRLPGLLTACARRIHYLYIAISSKRKNSFLLQEKQLQSEWKNKVNHTGLLFYKGIEELNSVQL